ncbi:GFA family protein [Streptomyces sp. NPDC096324]|uniref:GFA family protein n=1 Tax=Streptomyces sp. NPDC096324 TaxID=3366085 RepID=UPI00381F0202
MSNTSPTLGAPPMAARPLPATGAASDALGPVRTGHCQCGRISYQVTGLPDDPHLCSCIHETRISGGPAVLWVGFPLDTLIWTGPGGEPKWYATYPTLHRGFCPDCGTHLVSVADNSDMIMVTGFSLADRSGTDPVGHSFREEAVPWMTIALGSDPSARSLPGTDADS